MTKFLGSISILFVFFQLVACSTSTVRQIPSFSIEAFDALKIHSTSDEVLSNLGRPSKKVLLKEGPTVVEEIWLYRGKDPTSRESQEMDRLTIGFDPASRRLVTKTFFPFETEPENRLENVKSRYRIEKLDFEKAQFCGHFQLSDQYHHDYSRGLTVSEGVRNKEVNAISWGQSETKRPASVVDRCKPRPDITIQEI